MEFRDIGIELEKLCFVDLLFEVANKVRSLPFYHGARWNAWIRFACKEAHLCADEVFESLFALRSGQTPLNIGEIVCLRLVTREKSLTFLPTLVRCMMNMPPKGEFCSANLRFIGFIDTVKRRFLSEDNLIAGQVIPVSIKYFEEESEILRSSKIANIEFLSPIRLALPAGEKHCGMREKDRLCDTSWFSSEQNAVGHMLSHIRGITTLHESAMRDIKVNIIEKNLRWHDMRYNKQRTIVIGGIVGKLQVNIDTYSAALLLTIGQYLGSGKNRRFGLGFWRIAELDAVRKIPLK